MKICTQCRTENEEEATVCSQCGTDISKRYIKQHRKRHKHRKSRSSSKAYDTMFKARVFGYVVLGILAAALILMIIFTR